jgi:hypothetical protein
VTQTAEEQLANLLGVELPSYDIEPPKKQDEELQLKFLESDRNRRKVHRHKLNFKDREVISYCERYYLLNRGSFPSVAEIALNCKISTARVKYTLENSNVTEAFVHRGIENWDKTVDSSYLSPEQIACAALIANFADTRKVADKLDLVGVTPTQYYAWLNNPAYKEFVRSLAESSLENTHHEAIGAFIQLVRNGDLAAIKYYFEITGYADSSDAINLKLTIQRVIESIQRHVKDPETLAKIAMEIQGHAPVASSQDIKLQVES